MPKRLCSHRPGRGSYSLRTGTAAAAAGKSERTGYSADIVDTEDTANKLAVVDTADIARMPGAVQRSTAGEPLAR